METLSKPRDTGNFQRINLVLDTVLIEAFDSGSATNRNEKDLFIIRVMSTVKRLEKLFQIGNMDEGQWLEISLGRRAGNPLAWVLSAENDFRSLPQRLNVIGIKPITRLGRPINAEMQPIASGLTSLCSIQTRPRASKAASVVPTLARQKFRVRIVDVGHASFSAIHATVDSSSKIVGYFDVGGPVFFHRHTFPKYFPDFFNVPVEGFVVLSHWDFDHYSLAVSRMKSLQNLRWFAPNQMVGPIAAKLQNALGANLHFLSGNAFAIAPGLNLWKINGSTSDRNNSGYVMSVKTLNGRALLTGDANYEKIPAAAYRSLTSLAISHHGGAGCGTPPKPLSVNSVAAVSFGEPNRYGHPRKTAINLHTSLGWSIHPTFSKAHRGDVWLG